MLNSGWSGSGPDGGGGEPFVSGGPLLRELEAARGPLDAFRRAGGYALAERIAAAGAPDGFLLELNRAGVRGRAGGGYPTAHKWWLVARKEGGEKYFVCNANARPGDPKVPYLLARSPHAVLEAVAVGALLSGAAVAYLALPAGRTDLFEGLRSALDEAGRAGLLGPGLFGGTRGVEVRLFEIPDVYIAGEETALLEAIEGRRASPRVKPPLPTGRGLFGAPTVVSSLETVLQAWLALRVGAEAYRAHGTETSPGTMVFSLQGDVERPGLYELPLGTPLRALVFEHGGGTGGRALKLVFPGGLSSPPVGPGEMELPLDYDAARDAGTDLGSGAVLALAGEVDATELAVELAAFFHDGSCGKCRPCKEGTQRALAMLERLDR
ncbi:MAG TPA: NADH-ubiquinone oxidoreductase-F iron-sulfur binding region domain-containing protein, partial [Longimicrobium sp.]|nr:NADH-ubiquinone oxidoreductase-F iron-sulfur binding region domain-containing protein [Longimicrobium sp.]